MALTKPEMLVILEEAYYSGVKIVWLDGQRIEYQSMSDMWTAIVRLRNEITPTTRPPLVSFRPTSINRGRY